jgi:hypothetical protein
MKRILVTFYEVLFNLVMHSNTTFDLFCSEWLLLKTKASSTKIDINNRWYLRIKWRTWHSHGARKQRHGNKLILSFLSVNGSRESSEQEKKKRSLLLMIKYLTECSIGLIVKDSLIVEYLKFLKVDIVSFSIRTRF